MGLAILQFGWAALACALAPSDARLIGRMAPVAVPLVVLLGWTALPFWPDLSPGLIAPPAAPDVLLLAWCHAFSLIAVVLGCGVAARLAGFMRTTARWLCLFAAVLITGTLALRAFGDPAMVQRLIVDQRYHRFAGLMGNANAAGIGYGMISLLFHGVARDQWRAWQARQHRQPPVGAMIATFGGVVTLVLVALSQSRTALAATVIAHGAFGASILFPRPNDHPLLRRSVLTAAVIVAGAAAWGSAGAVMDRYATLGEDGSSRVAILRHYAHLASTAPLTGYGLGAFDTVNQRHLTSDTVLLVGDFGAAHNAVLQLAIEAGWPAVAFVAAALIAIAWRIARNATREDGRTATIGRAMLCSVAVAAAGSLVDIALNVPAIAALTAALLGTVWGRALVDRTAPRSFESAHPIPWPIDAMRN